MVSHRGECQIVYSINWNYDDVYEAVQNSPYTTKAADLPEGKAAGKFSFQVKDVPNVTVQVCGGSSVITSHKKGILEKEEIIFLIRAMKDVFWDRSGNLDNLVLKKIKPSIAWTNEVFYQSEDGKMLQRLEELLKTE